MTRTPLILGAIPLTIFAGALVGTAVATEPLKIAADTAYTAPTHAVEDRSLAEAQAMIGPQNQYRMETPDGIVEVSELALRGRFRNRMREQPYYFAGSEDEAYGLDGQQPEFANYEQSAEQSAADRAERVADRAMAAADNAATAAAPMPANFVPLERGIFENTEAAPAPQPTRFAQRDAMLKGAMAPADRAAGTTGTARTINVAQALQTP